MGRVVVEVVGARGDIERLLSEADVFVGVSRAALEAASAGLPVILCGNEGYAGILSEDNIPAHSNFCGRGCPLPDTETLYRDLRRILLMSQEERQALGNFGREYVIAHNSSDLTARSVAGVYEAVFSNRKKARRGRARRVAIFGITALATPATTQYLTRCYRGSKNTPPKCGRWCLAQTQRSAQNALAFVA